MENNLDLHLADTNSVSAANRQWTVSSEQLAMDSG